MEFLVLKIFQVVLSLFIIGGLLLVGRAFQLAIGSWLGIVVGIGVFLLFLVAIIVKIKEDDEEVETGG